MELFNEYRIKTTENLNERRQIASRIELILMPIVRKNIADYVPGPVPGYSMLSFTYSRVCEQHLQDDLQKALEQFQDHNNLDPLEKVIAAINNAYDHLTNNRLEFSKKHQEYHSAKLNYASSLAEPSMAEKCRQEYIKHFADIIKERADDLYSIEVALQQMKSLMPQNSNSAACPPSISPEIKPDTTRHRIFPADDIIVTDISLSRMNR